jgi:hypothetical protein
MEHSLRRKEIEDAVNRQNAVFDELVRRAAGEIAPLASTLGRDEAQVDAYLDFDIPLDSRAVSTQKDLDDVTQWLQQPRHYSGTGVLLDNTTLITLASLLQNGEYLSPLSLWDLGRAVTALIVYDNIFHLANPEINDEALNTALGCNIFRAVKLPELPDSNDLSGVHALFYSAWTDTHSLMRKLEDSIGTGTVEDLELKALANQWSLALDRPLSPNDMVNREDTDYSWNSPPMSLLAQLWNISNVNKANPVGYVLDSLGYQYDADVLSHPEMHQFNPVASVVREGNYRGQVNQRIADHLKLPYMPNMARMPFRNLYYDRARVVSDRLPSILALDTRYAERAAQAKLLSGPPFALPVFLALALRDATTPNDLWAAVATLREQARRYRERRTDLDRALEDGDLDVMAATMKAVRTEAAKVTTRLADAGRAGAGSILSSIEAQPVTLLSGMPLDWLQTGLTAVIAGVGGLLPESVTRRLAWRLFRPEFRFLSDIVSQSRAISTSMPAIQRLWGLPDRQIDRLRRRYESFARLQESVNQ